MDVPRRSERSPTERYVARSLIDGAGLGKPLPRRLMQQQRSVESYLRGQVMPRYMERAAEIERLTALHAVALRGVHRELAEEHGPGSRGQAVAWSEVVATWNFEHVNALIEQHNAYYPIERDLPMDPRTGDYVPVHGHSYRREPLGPGWARAVVELEGV